MPLKGSTLVKVIGMVANRSEGVRILWPNAVTWLTTVQCFNKVTQSCFIFGTYILMICRLSDHHSNAGSFTCLNLRSTRKGTWKIFLSACSLIGQWHTGTEIDDLIQLTIINHCNKINADNRLTFIFCFKQRMDSDIFMPYGPPADEYRRRLAIESELVKSLPQLINGKTKLVAWIVSNCGVGGRESYVKELQKHIDVDIYGGCGKKCNNESNPHACCKKTKIQGK